ncbi:MAG: hypothetical protein VX438_15855 [Planctomycetota bacterium]|nr:hypothetical protein [Planctomycetota bacterium]
MNKETALIVFLAAWFWVQTTPGNAQDPGPRDGMGGIRSGNTVIAPRPPYFAVYPPVYYNRIVARAYGISPFAMPPGMLPIENSLAVPPKSVLNPFFKPKNAVRVDWAVPSAGKSPVSGMARKIANPFFLQKVVTRQQKSLSSK